MDYIVTILGFLGHMVFEGTTQTLPPQAQKAITDNNKWIGMAVLQ